MTELVITVVATVAGWLARRYLSESAWRMVRAAARAILDNPDRTDDPKEAVREALAQVHEERVAEEAKKLANGVDHSSHL